MGAMAVRGRRRLSRWGLSRLPGGEGRRALRGDAQRFAQHRGVGRGPQAGEALGVALAFQATGAVEPQDGLRGRVQARGDGVKRGAVQRGAVAGLGALPGPPPLGPDCPGCPGRSNDGYGRRYSLPASTMAPAPPIYGLCGLRCADCSGLRVPLMRTLSLRWWPWAAPRTTCPKGGGALCTPGPKGCQDGTSGGAPPARRHRMEHSLRAGDFVPRAPCRGAGAPIFGRGGTARG